MIINGENIALKELKFMDYVAQKRLKIECLALELNGQIVPKNEFTSLILRENDRAEVVSFVGGG